MTEERYAPEEEAPQGVPGEPENTDNDAAVEDEPEDEDTGEDTEKQDQQTG
jgi:hypothetical protein